MTVSEIQRLVLRGEGEHLEFKKKALHPDKIVREMVAFANSGGGTLLIGVEDNGRISGVSFPEEEKYVMEAAIARYCQPAVPYELEIISIGSGKWVLKYRIPKGSEKPYYWMENPVSEKGQVYVRSGEQSLRASYEMYAILKAGKKEGFVQMGEKESALFSLFKGRTSLSIPEFALLSGMGKRRTSRLFVSLVLRGVLEIQPAAPCDRYRLSEAYQPVNQF